MTPSTAPTAFLSTPDQPWQTLALASAPADAPADLEILTTRQQTFRGWGGCFNELGWRAVCRLSPTTRQDFLRSLFRAQDGCGFTFCRLPLGANDYSLDWYSHADVPGDLALEHHSIARDRLHLLPYIHAAQSVADGPLRFFTSPWSPPAWMKERAVYNGSSIRWEPEVRAAYARYLLLSIRKLRAEGVAIEQLHVQNEPGSDQKFPSCLWTGRTLAEFIRDDLGPLFERESLDCQIWLGTLEKGIEHGYEPATIGLRNHAFWVLPALADPACRRHIAGIGLQWDGKGLLPKLAACHPNLPLMQTESECGDGRNTWQHMLYTADLVWHYLHHGAVAYACWNFILDEGGLSTWGWNQNSLATVDSAGTLTLRPEFYLYRHLGRIRPGAVRHGLAGPWSACALAFVNPNGSTAVVAWNPSPEPQALTLAVGSSRHLLNLPSSSLASCVFPA